MKNIKVIPVITIDNINHAVPVATALKKGGVQVIELVLRTKIALDAIKKINSEVPDIIVGAGSVNTPELFEQAKNAGAEFMVSPGFTQELLNIADTINTPYLPGVATISEAMQLQEQGYKYLKLFPAEAINARELLKAIYPPLPELRFCPTGGISHKILPEYLKLPNVICVGGSWLVPKTALENADFAEITKLACKI